jgi:plastocyanin
MMVNCFSLIYTVPTFVFFITTAYTSQVCSTGVVHRIFAGSTTANNGLHFEPENVVAEIGDLIEFHFLPKNHSVVQSSFEKPCEPLSGGNRVFSGFNYATSKGEAPDVFSFTVKSKEPFWYYCSQTIGSHCQNGMSGVINQGSNSDETLVKYKEKSMNSVTKQPSVDLMASQGGWKLPNTL